MPHTKEHTNWTLRHLITAALLLKTIGLLLHTLMYFPEWASDEQWNINTHLVEMSSVCMVVLTLGNITHHYHVTWKTVLLHELPIVLLYLLNTYEHARWVHIVIYGYMGLYGALFLLIGCRAAHRYGLYLRDEYANIYAFDYKKSARIILVATTLYILWLLHILEDELDVQAVHYLISGVLWFVLCVNIEQVIRAREASDMPCHYFDYELKRFAEKIAEVETAKELEDEAKRAAAKAQDPTEQPTVGTPQDTQEAISQSDANSVFLQKLYTVCEQPKLFTQEGITRDELASRMKMNHTYFTTMLRQATGKNFYEYINGLRMHYAEELLRRTDFPLDQVPLEVGYQHKSTYYRIFRETHGCTPAQWRDKQTFAAR